MSEIAKLRKPRPTIAPQPLATIGKSARTRAAILDAALAFLWEKPFREMTVAGVMKGVSAGRSAFYHHFRDLHDVMEYLLQDLQEDIMAGAIPWFRGTGEVTQLLRQSLQALVRVGYEKGPILRAVSDAAPNDERLERAWLALLNHFDEAVAARIEADQRQGLIPQLDARGIARAFNRMDAYLLIDAFGRHPRAEPAPLLHAIERIWISTLYEARQREVESPLVRVADALTAAAE